LIKKQKIASQATEPPKKTLSSKESKSIQTPDSQDIPSAILPIAEHAGTG
jgi:hypothetical protein